MSQRKLSQWFLMALMALGLVSCREAENGFRAPEITKAEAVIEGTTATLRCILSNERIDRCGFRLSDGEKESELEAVLSGSSFEATVQGLQVEKTYSFVAFAAAGESEVSSLLQSFTAPDGAIPVPDPAFKEYLLREYDCNGDGEISRPEATVIWRISFCTNELNVKSLSGIEYMPGLEEISCTGDFIGLELGNHKHFHLSNKYHWDNILGPIGTLETIDVSHNPELRVLRLFNNAALGENMRTLDLSGNLKLTVLDLGMTALQMPDVSHLPGLTELLFTHLWGPFPDLKLHSQLRKLDISFEQTNGTLSVDVSHCPYLEELVLSGTATELSDLSYNPQLRKLAIKCCGFSGIDLSALTHLRFFDGSEGYFRSVDVSANPELTFLDLSPMVDNLLETLYLAPGQRIPGVTENRSEEFIPRYTKIVEKSVE